MEGGALCGTGRHIGGEGARERGYLWGAILGGDLVCYSGLVSCVLFWAGILRAILGRVGGPEHDACFA